ncbi:MAG: hypothetical protein H0V17_35280 [Deltaproteobacteria bacterium]|nr:hypothetical protein [Deltaproteobacteria bacterium]
MKRTTVNRVELEYETKGFLLAIACLVLGLAACGSKHDSPEIPNSPDKVAVEKYINTDMNALIGVLWVGKRPLENITPAQFETAPGWFVRPGALDTTVIPRMKDFIAGSAKVTPPASMTQAHSMGIAVATAYRDVAAQLIDAAETKDEAKFVDAHAKLMDGHARYLRWQKLIDGALTRNGIKLRDPPAPQVGQRWTSSS